jgi:hypothetical protein
MLLLMICNRVFMAHLCRLTGIISGERDLAIDFLDKKAELFAYSHRFYES